MDKRRSLQLANMMVALVLLFCPLGGCAKKAVSAPGVNIEQELAAETRTEAATASSAVVSATQGAPLTAAARDRGGDIVTGSSGIASEVAGPQGTPGATSVAAEVKDKGEPYGAVKGGAAMAPAVGSTTAGASTYYLVQKGDCLWNIAKKEEIYADPYLWPIIHEVNKEMIKNPHLIYPGQRLNIPREGYTLEAIQRARQSAGAKKPYTPPKTAKPPRK
ncbi:MAG: LysM peptidoglycan-binding domain-containing protein [Syntrophales bacterium]|nr:LysM peptidoglycan-binding domain-containing protein [Syntrophales bacterium]